MDFTYQQGQTSNTSINYTLDAECSANAPYDKRNNDDGSIKYDGALPILMVFLKSSVLAIQLRGNCENPMVAIS
jgi:hypothetical protein